MIEVLGETANPNGRIPQIGDNDNGRFLVFRPDRDAEDLQIDYLLETAQRNRRIAPNIRGALSVSYPQTGRYLFRSARIYMLVSAGPKGQAGRGGHAHNDVLSFELNIDGEDVIVDPGTYCYTRDPESRNHFRSVYSHSTLSWKELEPCSFDYGLFALPEQGTLAIEKCSLGETEDFFSAVYEYKSHFHSREICFRKTQNKIEIKDSCSHKGALLFFICAPGIDLVIKDETFQAGKADFCFNGAKKLEVEPSYYSPAYGKRIRNKIVKVHLSGKSCHFTIGLSE
jgi:hypothetical protein